jgi:Uma2 family endonuclease
LELKTEDAANKEDAVNFRQENDGHFKEIDHFLMIVKDWAEEIVSQFDEASPKKRPDVQGIKGFYDSQQVEI